MQLLTNHHNITCCTHSHNTLSSLATLLLMDSLACHSASRVLHAAALLCCPVHLSAQLDSLSHLHTLTTTADPLVTDNLRAALRTCHPSHTACLGQRSCGTLYNAKFQKEDNYANFVW